MNFTFTQDQLDFQDAIASMLRSEVTADTVRSRWATTAGVDERFLSQVHELGLNSMLVPEALGGLGPSRVTCSPGCCKNLRAEKPHVAGEDSAF